MNKPPQALSSDNLQSEKTRYSKLFGYLGALVVLLVSFFSFYINYEKPDKLFWDENYHIASSQKYIDGVFFLEHHPPLGKLLIALGENLTKANQHLDLSSFNTVDHLKNTPKGYSFKGVRLMPVLSLMLSAVVFYFIMFEISKSWILSICFSSLFLFDTAIITHSRAAHLEAFQFLFIFLAILIFCRALIRKDSSLQSWSLMGVFTGLAVAIKLNSAILLILFLTRYLYELFSRTKPSISKELSLIAKAACSLLISALILIGSYYVHFRLARTPLEKRFYASEQALRQSILSDDTSLKSFAIFMKEQIRYVKRFSDGVPRLKPDGPNENGSHPVFWPLGKKSISYRWDKTKDGKVIHHRLQANPIGWAISFIALILSCSLIIAHRVFKFEVKEDQETSYRIIESISFMWLSYMIVMLNIGRVMYLYHYLIPLCFGFILALQIFQFIFYNFERDDLRKRFLIFSGITFLFVAQALCFWHFRHFAYQIPLSPQDFAERQWLSLWRYQNVLW